MLIGFKTRIKTKKSQLEILAKHAGTARHAWNQGLALCREVLAYNKVNPESKIKFPTAIDLHKWLVASVKVENPPAAIAFRRATAEKLAGGTTKYQNVLRSMP